MTQKCQWENVQLYLTNHLTGFVKRVKAVNLSRRSPSFLATCVRNPWVTWSSLPSCAWSSTTTLFYRRTIFYLLNIHTFLVTSILLPHSNYTAQLWHQLCPQSFYSFVNMRFDTHRLDCFTLLFSPEIKVIAVNIRNTVHLIKSRHVDI